MTTSNSNSKMRDYYERTAEQYDAQNAFDKNDEHYAALAFLQGQITHYSINSLLDVGSGTGRAIQYLLKQNSNLRLEGIEPVAALRRVAANKGIPENNLKDGDAKKLPYTDNAFECVSAFGVLHHVDKPEHAIREMLRVAQRAIFISDSNVYGWGTPLTRTTKQFLHRSGLRKLFCFLSTRGKGYYKTGYDGIFYPFSLLDYYSLIEEHSVQMTLVNTKTNAINFYRQASHIAIMAWLK